ncbi:hypothetical protein GHT06_017076 [Daphnia sinensis]|uniref:Uncharacterized protein n=1 Tax=Daphnia sinensis TaxID=1820382 RepID=A0AAD5LGJ9_9CRUS|nr:hypothetical protein GHT06_017076 [Daphnia sinensis]
MTPTSVIIGSNTLFFSSFQSRHSIQPLQQYLILNFFLRFFGIIRMSGRCGDKPRATSFLELFRLLTFYYPTKLLLRGSNCDSEEEKHEVLTSYHLWIKTNFNNNKKEMQKRKEYLKDILFTGIMREINLKNGENCSQDTFTKPDTTIDVLDIAIRPRYSDIIYYICGYMVHSMRKKGKLNNSSFCQNYMATVDMSPEDLPPNFTASQLTEIKKKGKLIFASSEMFKLICAAEEAFLSLAKKNRIFLRDAFESVLLILSVKILPLIGCTLHIKEMMSTVIFQYLILRFRCFAKKKWLRS